MVNGPALFPASARASRMPLTIAPVTALELPVRGRLEMILMVPLVAPPPPPPVAPPPPPPLPPEPAASLALPPEVPPLSLCDLHPPDITTSAIAIEIVVSFLIAGNLVLLANAGQSTWRWSRQTGHVGRSSSGRSKRLRGRLWLTES